MTCATRRMLCRSQWPMSTSTVDNFRRNGFVVFPPKEASHLISSSELQAIRTGCVKVMLERGEEPTAKRAEESKTTVKLEAYPATASASKPGKWEISDKAKFSKHVMKTRFRLRNQRDVDRAYELLKRRQKENVDSGRVSPELHQQIERNFSTNRHSREQLLDVKEQDVKQSFESYRDSGKLEQDIRKRNHLDDLLAYVKYVPQLWLRLWPHEAALRQLLLTRNVSESTDDTSSFGALAECVGSRLGEVAGLFTGSPMMRLYTDALTRLPLICNSVAPHCSCVYTNFRGSSGIDIAVALPGPPAAGTESIPDGDAAVHQYQAMVVYPQSHQFLAELTQQGHEVEMLRKAAFWDIGGGYRSYPQLRSIDPVVVPLPPGTIVFSSALLMRGMIPMMAGRLRSAYESKELKGAGQHVVDASPMLYHLQLMPDGAAFDGNRNTWMAKDPHGPLFAYNAGDAIRDDVNFPVLHRALDIE